MPLFETDDQNGHFLATMPIHRAFIDEKAYLASIGKEMDANEQYNDKKDDKIKLSDLQEHILILIKGNDKITIPELARKARTSESSISRALRKIQNELHLLSREGGRKDGRWVILINT